MPPAEHVSRNVDSAMSATCCELPAYGDDMRSDGKVIMGLNRHQQA
jgi:hypothetical protein